MLQQEMGACLSSATKVSGSSSSNAASAAGNPAQQREQQKLRRSRGGAPKRQHHDQNRRPRERERVRRTSGVIPCGKRTSFGYARDFESRYTIGKLLGHGQFGYTFVATDIANGDRVAVKRIDKNKVNSSSPLWL